MGSAVSCGSPSVVGRAGECDLPFLEWLITFAELRAPMVSAQPHQFGLHPSGAPATTMSYNELDRLLE